MLFPIIPWSFYWKILSPKNPRKGRAFRQTCGSWSCCKGDAGGGGRGVGAQEGSLPPLKFTQAQFGRDLY